MAQTVNILVVEDREDWQHILCRTLTQAGYAPHAATSYEAAVAALQGQAFELALVDPVLDPTNRFNRDGLRVIQMIRDTQPAMRIAIITGSLTRDLKSSLEQLYANATVFFKENWDPAEFSHVVQSLLGTTSPASSTQANDSRPVAIVTPPLHRQPPLKAMGRPRVLLVENREDWQQIVGSVLDGAGYFWRAARNAQEALLELEQESFHLVILDLKLQEANLPLRSSEGWQLLDYLVEARPKTKVVILSGKASPGDVADLMTGYPIIGFIEKQRFTPEDIEKAVAEATKVPELRIQTFGQFRLWRDGQVIDEWERAQAETVVKLLLIRRARGGRAVSADELITRLWPETDEVSGRKKLLPLISNARRTLEEDIEPRDSNFILRSATGYFFELGGAVTWDLIEFRQHLRRGQECARTEDWAGTIAELEQGRSLYSGDFLAEDRYADWVIDIQREIVGEFRDLLILLADAYAALDRYPEAIDACEAALRKDPLLESVYRRLMRFHYCNGEKGQAMKVYRDCLTLFEELFGESPTPATRRVHEAIANDEPLDCRGDD
jgi:DNA-binding SARP family transcriptional activator/ActR/RegA family two-component response regulator